MNLVLSWNLFIVVVFVVIVAYSFIIGLNRTLKTIIGTYLAILAADGLGNILQEYVFETANFQKVLETFVNATVDETLIVAKVIIFISVVVILSVKGAFDVHISSGGPAAVPVTGIFGFLNAGLILSTLLVYVSGLSFVQAVAVDTNIVDLYSGSEFIKGMVDYYNFWFSLPVIGLIIWSLFFNDPE